MWAAAAATDRPVPSPRFAFMFLASALALLAVGVGDSRSARPAPPPPSPVSSTELTQGWALRSANDVTDGGATISQVGYATPGWYPTSIPSTVLAGLVANNVYQDVYFGTNLQTVPDLTGQ